MLDMGQGTPVAGTGYRRSLVWRAYDRLAEKVDRVVGWDRLPRPLGLAVLVGIRNGLRKENLYDTTDLPATNAPPVAPPSSHHLTARTADGTYNDLDHPRMGMAGSRFGRNVPLDRTHPEVEPDVLSPNPRVVSRRLLTRKEFIPAPTLNVLAASWLQFMIRDWFTHGKSTYDNPWRIPLASGDDWPESSMTIPRVREDPTAVQDGQHPSTFANVNSHWWDASSIYGNNADEQHVMRSHVDGHLRIDHGDLLPPPKDPRNDPSTEPGFWIGNLMLHVVFSLEHNAICDRLKADHPHWTDDELFERGRLINAALIAKIHTVEWTPAIISHPTTVLALRANWWGIASERIHRLLGRISKGEILSGIPGSATDHFGVPYSLTEEFVAVYRMHQLIPDDYAFRSASDDRLLRSCGFREIAGPAALQVADDIDMADLFYSFGTMHPGAIVLNNFPRFLQEFERPDGKLMDLAATDILRTRELGVPRYNEFRRLMRMAPFDSFDALTDDAELAAALHETYDGDIERLDLMVGMFAERRPKGFAFSDTAFRIFVLMASRRLNSDRFFTRDYRPEVYTQAGLDWIADNSMVSVMLRHFPQLRPALRGVTNGFTPWTVTAT